MSIDLSHLPPAIPGVDPFPFPELNSILHSDVQLSFSNALLRQKRSYTGREPLRGQVVLDGF